MLYDLFAPQTNSTPVNGYTTVFAFDENNKLITTNRMSPEEYQKYLGTLPSDKVALLKDYNTKYTTPDQQSAAMNMFNASKLSDWAKFTGAMGDVNKAIIAPAKDLMSTYTAWKGYEQARKEFDLNRSLINQNLANQASMINRGIDASANIAAQQSGLYGNSAAIQQYNNQVRNDTLANANANKIKHNPL